MKLIKFNNIVYTLTCDEVSDSANLRVAIFKNENTIPEVAEVVSGVNTIYILEDEEIIAQYNGFTRLVSLSICDEYPLQYGNGSSPFGAAIIIELQNTDIQSQLNNVNASVTNLETTVTENQATTDAAISDLGEAVDGLVDSQATQDLAIEDLTEAVSELEGE